jgi:hypothetical protein
MTTQLVTISTHALSTVTGGFLDRSDFQAGGRSLAESAVTGVGAGVGAYYGGKGGAFAGGAGADLLNKTGAPGNFGDWAGGKTFDAISQPPTLDTSGGPQP